jgi:predicted DNA-binding protein
MYEVKELTLNRVYSEEPRTKLLTVKMSPSELELLANTARNSGNTISSFTREALQNYIQSFVEFSQ